MGFQDLYIILRATFPCSSVSRELAGRGGVTSECDGGSRMDEERVMLGQQMEAFFERRSIKSAIDAGVRVFQW